MPYIIFTVAFIILAFQNCSGDFRAESTTNQSSTGAPFLAQSIFPPPEDGPTHSGPPPPATSGAVRDIPLTAISDVSPCAPFCFKRYVDSAKTQVVTDIKIGGNRSTDCEAGYVYVGVTDPNRQFPLCLRYESPELAERFLTGLYSAVNEYNCANGYVQFAMVYHRRGIELMCAEFRGRAQLPTHAVTEIFRSHSPLSYATYRQYFAWFNAAEVDRRAHWGRITKLTPESLVIVNARILAPGSACPAGYTEILQAGNTALPDQLQPLCVRRLRADRAPRALTGMYVSGVEALERCQPGDVNAGQITTYGGTPAAPKGAGNLCLRF